VTRLQQTLRKRGDAFDRIVTCVLGPDAPWGAGAKEHRETASGGGA
jgi:hypothetical protein